MRILLSDGPISIYRGDSKKLPLFINCRDMLNPECYKLNERDKIYIALMQCDEKFEKAIYKSVWDKSNCDERGIINFQFYPKDTEYLEPGIYFLQIKGVFHINGEEIVETLLPKRKFIILD